MKVEKTFNYESKPFQTKREMELEKKELMEALMVFLGVENRSDFHLPQGLIKLVGINQSGQPLPITSKIGDFAEYIKNFQTMQHFVLRN